MKFVEHGVYLIRNVQTNQSQYFEAFEVIEYKGHLIVYGELRHDYIRIFRGNVETAGKPVAFPILLNTLPGEVAQLIAVMGGYALAISEARDLVVGNIKAVAQPELLLMNCNRGLAQVWGGSPWLDNPRRPNRDGLVFKCTHQIDLYLDWKRLGHVPAWFIEDKRKALAPINRN